MSVEQIARGVPLGGGFVTALITTTYENLRRPMGCQNDSILTDWLAGNRQCQFVSNVDERGRFGLTRCYRWGIFGLCNTGVALNANEPKQQVKLVRQKARRDVRANRRERSGADKPAVRRWQRTEGGFRLS